MHPTDRSRQPEIRLDYDRFRRAFTPSSIAVIGASESPAKIGSQILSNIISGGYAGTVYPVNPDAKRIQGLPVFSNVADIPGPIDHAVIAIPAPLVPDVVDRCAEKDIPGVTIVAAGFKEIGPEGRKLEQRLIDTALEHTMYLLGPNCLGFMNTDIKLNATFSATSAQPGNIVLFSQSGAFGTAILDWANQVNLGFKYFISLGNKAVLDETVFLDFWARSLEGNTENTVFAGYLEDIKRGRKFMETASKLTRRHPIIMLKPGKSEAAQAAITSHTGALATKDTIVDAALRESGCIRAAGIQQLFDTIQLLARQSIPANNKVAIVTNAGGAGVLTTDQLQGSLLELAPLSETTTYALQQVLPSAASTTNPVDILGDASANRYFQALDRVLADENVGSAIVLLTPQAVTEVEKTASVIAEAYRKYPFKPVIPVFIGGEIITPGVTLLHSRQMPIFNYPRQAIKSLANAYRYRTLLDTPPIDHLSDDLEPTVELPSLSAYILGKEAEWFVNQYGIPTPPSEYITSDETITDEQIARIGFPLAVKIISPKILHKTDLSAVKLNITTKEALLDAIASLSATWHDHFPDDPVCVIQIQKYLTDGELVIMGFEHDPSFGPVVLFGAGGILTELFNDTSQGIAPVTAREARTMIMETRISKVLSGYRGKVPRDIASIAECLVKLSTMALEHPDIREFDINPFIVLNEGSGGFAVDIKIITNRAAPDGQETISS